MKSFEEIIEVIKAMIVKDGLSSVAYNLWIAPVKGVALDGTRAMIYVPDEFIKNVLETNYIEYFERRLQEILGFRVDIVIKYDESSNNSSLAIPELEDDKELSQRLKDSERNSTYNYTFDTFIEGESNKLAYAACKAVASGQKNYNPLYIYGNPGLGKTHLLLAVKHYILSNYPQKNILFVSTDTYITDFVDSIRFNKTTDFKKKYRTTDILLMDDIQFLSGKKEVQQELFNIFNELHTDGKQIIFTSDRVPKEINDIDQRLQSRFEWGLITDIQIPEFETRFAIIQRKAHLMNLKVSTSVLELIADKLKENIRQLEGAVIKLSHTAEINGVPPTLSMARDIVDEVLTENTPTPVTVKKIIDEVASIYGVTGDEIRGKGRSAKISTARQIASYVIHKTTQLSYVEIGKELGDRDHSTIIYAVKKVTGIMEKDKSYRNTIEDLIKNVMNV